MSKGRSDYEVGWGKPPKGTRFKKGHSGNPHGRSSGTKNLKTDLQEELQEKIVVREGGGVQRRLSKQRAIVKALMAKALHGDPRSIVTLISLVSRFLPMDEDLALAPDLSPEDEAILKAYEARLLRRATNLGDSHE